MTRADLRHRVILNTGRRDKDEAINAFLNDALDDLAKRISFQELEATLSGLTTPGKREVDRPQEAAKIHVVRVDGRILREVHPLEIELLEPRRNVRITGKPQVWALRQNKLWLWPVPNESLTVELYVNVWPTHMDDDGASPPMEHADTAIIDYATSELFWSTQQFEAAGYWRTKYNASVKELQSIIEDRPGWTPGLLQVPHRLSPSPQADPFVKGWRD